LVVTSVKNMEAVHWFLSGIWAYLQKKEARLP
jgi:hypothetical protein